jgi:hypothetical protein
MSCPVLMAYPSASSGACPRPVRETGESVVHRS